jgi:hypothetical protein
MIVLAAISIVLAGTELLTATTPGTSSNVQLVGQNPLFGRGMNAAAANYKNFLYVGNRTDGSSRCGFGDPRRVNGLDTCPHPHPGILIVDINNPASPTVVGEIPAPLNPAGQPVGITSREVRVWPQKKLLMTMNFRCSSLLHACPRTNDTTSPFDIKFFSLSDPVHPQFISHYVPTSGAGVQVKPHEMFLWADPNNQGRALLFLSTPNIFADSVPNLLVVDISQVPSGGSVTEVAEGNWNDRYPGTNQSNYPFDNNSGDGCGPYDCNLFVHSMSVKPDGTLTFLALEAGHFLVLDTSQVTAGVPNPQLVLLTDPKNRPVWLQDPLDPTAVPGEFPGGCARQGMVSGILSSKDCPNSHSAVKVPGRNLALTTDEVYGTLTFFNQGCRWGWARLIDVSDPTKPFITGEYAIDEDSLSFCTGTGFDDPVTEATRSYSSHNPTLTQNLAIIDWHSGGLQIIDTSDQTNPVQAGFYVPDPPSSVANEDPGLSQGTASRNNKTVFWSYPIIKDGLIYVIDIRNGLFVFQYTGPHAGEVQEIHFLEGNSNLGDAVDLDQNRNSQ